MTRATFGIQARHLHSDLRRSGAVIYDMRSAGSLEHRIGGDFADDAPGAAGEERQFRFSWLESDRPFARPVIAPGQRSPVAYFLDGTQRTLPGYHCAAVPILASITAAAILERRSPTDLRVMPGMIALDRSWLSPLQAANAGIAAFNALVQESGISVVDPLSDLAEPAYADSLGDYAAMERRALQASRLIRGRLERNLLARWEEETGGSGTWIVVDGALHAPARNAIGLVKSFTRQYVSGHHAEELFRLPAGHRSPALLVEDRWRSGTFAIWYLRLWDATGRDPRHSLIRVETSDPGLTTLQVDEISGWILAERTPRATADSRWPTMLYPIHYLEQILKRYTENEMRFWPGAGAGS